MKAPSSISYQEALNRASSFLHKHNKDQSIGKWLMWDLYDLDLTQWLRVKNTPMPDNDLKNYQAAIRRVALEDYPWQYISGRAWFYGLALQVSPNTLIPRQETEDLVTLALEFLEQSVHKKVLDIGTGTGAIALAIKSQMPKAEVVASDISAEALAVAKENAKSLDLAVDFVLGDSLEPIGDQSFDLIVSNPPYIGSAETAEMGSDVLKYEPHLALFADNQGYGFYDHLLADLGRHLNPGGLFIGEMGYQQAQNLEASFFKAYPDHHVYTCKDYTGHKRFILMQDKGGH
ncbi:peptide chain release factor N(5)-glutamine methyltransferase [Aerococcus kribbianus]|uniref:Release factor glutamine methyltransferase n=1 Tax=Aerococcus kribbianus TaxID=2999064 RepID=A0A9X3JED3_9LACT|nr:MULTISPECIES: peptide chain release factor N(5)-glutamine methyltransferase [unclassified Aerococcus]MCZ0716974.1 peptide chain release factor N(5)-glutamine methyltransferase [Aerococcus sp. YH-aer221]MCZ0725262.1 peptide chain release factor N(5)-glutamine methyltransferase [Aerococcus sp. YH-aer222]